MENVTMESVTMEKDVVPHRTGDNLTNNLVTLASVGRMPCCWTFQLYILHHLLHLLYDHPM